MKKVVICLVLFIALPTFFSQLSVFSENDDNGNITDEILSEYGNLYAAQIESGAGSIINDALLPYQRGFNLEEFIKRISSGEVPLNPLGILKELIKSLLGQIIAVSKNMLVVVAIVVLSSVLTGMVTAFERNAAGQIAYYVCFIAIAALCSSVFYDCLSSAMLAIENLSVFMRCIVPVMITALITCGAIVSATALEPVLITVIEISVTMIKSVFMPLVMIGTGLSIINAMSSDLKTTKLITLINSTVKYGLSVILTVFVTFAGLQSIASSGADTLTLRLTKFASSNLIPVVGGILSESVETVMNCSNVIKNSVGVIGVILLFFIAIMPILNIVAALLVFRLVAAFCEPIADKSIVDCVSGMADGISSAFSMLVAVTVMFIIIITVMINISM